MSRAAESLQVPDGAGVVPSGGGSAPVATVVMDATDALIVGQTLRSLARDRKTPLGIRELLTRVGSQMTSEGRLSLAAGKIR